MNRYILMGAGAMMLFIAPLVVMAVTGQSISRNVALTIIFVMAIMGPSIVMAATGYSSIGALGRNPSAAPKILTAMTIMLVGAQVVAVLAFLIVWQLFTPQ